MGVDRIFAKTGDSWVSKPRRRATYWLIGITAGIFFLIAIIRNLSPSAMAATDSFLDNWLVVSADGLLGGRVWQLFTYQLIHGGAMHLVFNMLVLFFLGTLYEDLNGSKNLVWTYFLCGAFSGLACFIEGSMIVGASGSVLGLLIVLAVKIPNQIVYLLFFPIRMKWVAVIIVSLDVLQLAGGARDGISHFGHLMGAFAGFGYAYIWPRMIGPKFREASGRRQRRREVAEMERTLQEDRELDRILDKISREGMGNLSEVERRFLRRTSRKLQDSKRP